MPLLHHRRHLITQGEAVESGQSHPRRAAAPRYLLWYTIRVGHVQPEHPAVKPPAIAIDELHSQLSLTYAPKTGGRGGLSQRHAVAGLEFPAKRFQLLLTPHEVGIMGERHQRTSGKSAHRRQIIRGEILAGVAEALKVRRTLARGVQIGHQLR